MVAKTVTLSALLAMGATYAAAETHPLSAIEWLNQTPTVTLDMGLPEAPVSAGALKPAISVDTLGVLGRDAVGLLPPKVTGLPDSLWQHSQAGVLATLVTDQHPTLLPAMQALLYTVLLAEANAPWDAGTQDALLLARIDKLVDMGALEQATALVERAGATTPELFKRWFDVTLLMGFEDAACRALVANPRLAPDYASRVFCTARTGDWNSAALMLETANALDLITDEEDALLVRFLDPDLFEDQPILTAQSDPSPLIYRLYEAIGEPQPTRSLPRPFAHADLRTTVGWKPRLEAAERLARTGALPENRLLGIYSEGKPSASGMIWDRVDAVQVFDRALESRDVDAISDTLPSAWSAMQSKHLEVPFARLYGHRLLAMPLKGVTARLARDIGLLSPAYEQAALAGPRDFLAGLAQGNPPQTPLNPLHRSIADGFHEARVPQHISAKLARGQLGEVILNAMSLMEDGAYGDLAALTDAIAIFRAVGLEDTARRVALQATLIDTRG
ncbi:hypothetical protein SAMN05444000_106184 [Shimia gijangensis]|uniref:Uncharacterized protein n=1 Tax=Shimia gijangensis TaxID=1470563 RepID=A0A1M6HXA4_9RHOB|nr:hypothetical protein [Shimia gijangensis]SHJ26825.1 hypothetical protein SAMN05444000_106184 [Shimia gijangensis]